MKNFKKVFAVLAACTMAAGMISVAACTPEEPGPGPDGPGIVTPVEVSVTVNPTTKSIEAEQTFEITATVTNSDKNPVWESSNPAVATVAGTGKKAVVTAVAAGTANITATVDGKKATCALTVTAKPVVVEELTLDKEYEVLEASGDKATATLTATNIGDGVTFTSSDPEVVTVTAEEGVATLTAVKLGAATITAVSGDFTKTCKVEVANAGLKYNLDADDDGNYFLSVSDGDTKVTGELRIPAYYYDDAAEDYVPVTTIAKRGFVDATPNGDGGWNIAETNRITEIYTGDNVVKVDDNAFTKCKSLKTINVAPNLEVFGGGAFDECGALDTINWAENGKIRTLGSCCFRFTAFTEFVVPATITEFNYGMFQGAEKLETVKIDAPISIIYNDTFLNCQGLRNIYIPKTVTEIQRWAFGFYVGLTEENAELHVYYGGTEEEWDAIHIVDELNDKILKSKNNKLDIHYSDAYYNPAE